MRGKRSLALSTVLLLAGGALLPSASALAHCDGLDGPVVKAARAALESGDVDLVLVWVQPGDEEEIRRAFDHALAVRALGPEARELADTWFFETLVRVHRAGEGAAYTGLKPAGRDLGPAIPLADEAIASGDVEPLAALITAAMQHGLAERFEHARNAAGYAVGDLAAGREYVHAYVIFLHYVERLYEAASQPAAGHFPETAHTADPHAR